jgi:hypothetical protein
MTGNLDITGTLTSDGLTVDANNTNAPQVIFENSHSVTTDAAISTYDDAAGVAITLGSNYYLNSAGSAARFNTSEESAGILVDRTGVITLKTDNSGSSVAKDRLNIAGNGDISFYEDTGTTTKFFWDASAESLGIGTSSPQRPLHVDGVEGVARFTSTASGNNGFEVGIGASSQAFLWQSENSYMQFATNATERMRIDSSGNVNIGVSSGAGTLTIASSGNTGLLLRQNTAVDRFKFFVGDGTGGYAVDENFISSNNTNLRFLAGGFGTTEVMQLTSGGDLLVGTTNSAPASNNVDGVSIRVNNSSQFSRTSGAALSVNRKTSDGEIAVFSKDGSTVGSIGTDGSRIYIGTGDTGLYFWTSNNAVLPWNTTTNVERDNAIDLGNSIGRFKDLYLSGGVVETTTTVTYASSIALTYDNGSIQTVTLTGNVTFTDSLADGESIVLMLNAGASYTVTWPTLTWVTSGGNVAPTLTANDTLVFWKIGSTLYGAYAGSYT